MFFNDYFMPSCVLFFEEPVGEVLIECDCSGDAEREGREGQEVWRGEGLDQCRVMAMRVSVERSCQEKGWGLPPGMGTASRD